MLLILPKVCFKPDPNQALPAVTLLPQSAEFLVATRLLTRVYYCKIIFALLIYTQSAFITYISLCMGVPCNFSLPRYSLYPRRNCDFPDCLHPFSQPFHITLTSHHCYYLMINEEDLMAARTLKQRFFCFV